MKELILTWNTGTMTRTLYSAQPGIAHPKLRIGRDPVTCDLVLPSITQEDLTVSKLHVELYFDPTADQFYLRNLKGKSNPPKLYGNWVDDVPVPVDHDGELQLGRRVFQISVVLHTPIVIAPTTPPDLKAESTPTSALPLTCPHCASGYNYEEATKFNGRCPKDGFFLHGASIYIP